MDMLDNLFPEIKDQIFSFIPVSTLKAANSIYFKQYMDIKCKKMGATVNVYTYFRNIIRYDNGYVLNVFLECAPVTIFRRHLSYRKTKMTFMEYINTLTIYYGASKCRKYMLDKLK
jgi:hypothetical protein